MVLYRRNRVAGGTYFFTVTLRNRSSDVLVRHVDLLSDAFRLVRAERPFTIDAIVILPEHLHTIWTLPEGDADYSGRWSSLREILSVQQGVSAPFQRADGGALHIRKATRPETELAAIYQALNLDPLPGGVQKTYV